MSDEARDADDLARTVLRAMRDYLAPEPHNYERVYEALHSLALSAGTVISGTDKPGALNAWFISAVAQTVQDLSGGEREAMTGLEPTRSEYRLTSDDIPRMREITAEIYKLFRAQKLSGALAFGTLAYTLAHVIYDKAGVTTLETNLERFGSLVRQIASQIDVLPPTTTTRQ